MLIGQGLLAHVSFTTNRAGAGTSTVLRAFKCLVSGSLQPGAPGSAGLGRYQLTLDPDVPVDVSDADLSVSIGGTAGGTAANGTVVMVFHASATVKEVNFYTVAAAGGVLTDLTPAGQAITCNVTFRRVNPA